MKMNPQKRLKTSNNAMKVFKACVVMMLLSAIMILAYGCIGAQDEIELNAKNLDLVQYKVPKDDAKVVVFETTMGTMKAVLYEEYAPKYCEYFIDLVESGYYNDTYYFQIESDQNAYAFGGAKSNTGNDTDDTDKKNLEPEKTESLWPFRGALCTYGKEKGIFNKRNLTGSRILFVNSVEFTDELIDEMKSIKDANEDLVNNFIENGGVPNFSQQFTVFGQVYCGLDVLESICNAEVNDQKQPVEDIKIISATISTYKEHKLENEEEFFKESFKTEDSSQADDSSNFIDE